MRRDCQLVPLLVRVRTDSELEVLPLDWQHGGFTGCDISKEMSRLLERHQAEGYGEYR